MARIETDYTGCDSVTQRIRRFDETHGGGDNCVVIGDILLFADGAYREAANPYGQLNDGGEDDYRRNKLIVKFHETKLALAVEEFSVLKRNCIIDGRTALREKDVVCPSNPDEKVERLKMLQKKVRVCQENLAEAKDNLEKSKPDVLRRREKFNAYSTPEVERFLSEITKIEV